jgi:hypothetical protein
MQDLLAALVVAHKNQVRLVLEIHLQHPHPKVLMAALLQMVLQQLRRAVAVAVQVQ